MKAAVRQKAAEFSVLGAADRGEYRQAARTAAQGVILVGVRRLARQVNRIFKLIFARLARPDVANTIVRQMLNPFRRDDLRVTLGVFRNCHGKYSGD